MSNKNSSPWQIAGVKLKHNKMAMIGLSIILLAFLISLLGAYIRPDKSQFADEKQLSLAKNKPGFSCKILKVPIKDAANVKRWNGFLFGGVGSEFEYVPIDTFWISNSNVMAIKYFDAANSAYNDTVIFDQTVFQEKFPPQLKRTDGSSDKKFREFFEKDFVFNRTYLLGTDKFGRDILSRLMAGTIISLSVGFISVFISLILGISLGLFAGYYGGRIDYTITWLINVVWSIPTLLMVIALTLVLGKGFTQVFIAVGLTMWVEVARVVRGQVMSTRQEEFVVAGRALGFSDGRIMFNHILPVIVSPLIVISAANFASAILIEAGLSFLGIGTQVPMPSWGYMIKEHYPYLTTDLSYMALLPGLCIMVLVLAFMLLGKGLRDALDSKWVQQTSG